MPHDLDPAVAARVIDHMNEDHADAVLLYVQTFGSAADATEARMVSISLAAMELEYRGPTGINTVQIAFKPPLSGPEELRPRLVAMVGTARGRLSQGQRE